MKLRPIFVVAVSLCLGALAYAQDAQEGPTPAYQNDAGPAHLGDEAPSLATDNDAETRNVVVAGFSVGAVYDNNGLYHSTAAPYYTSDTRYFIEPNIGFRRTFSEGDWTLSYSPGVSISQHDTSENQYSNNFAGELNWKPSSLFQFHARQDYSLTDNPFESVGNVQLLPSLGGLYGPNYDGVLPQTRRTSLVSTVDMTYRVADHSAVGLTGGYQRYDYDALNLGGGVLAFPFVDSDVYNGSAFYSQQLSSVVNAGVQLSYVDIYSRGAMVSRTQAPAPMVFIKATPSARLSFTLYAGPQYARTRDVLTIGGLFSTAVYSHSWYPTYGGSLTWSGHRNAFDVQAMRRISNGSGVLDAVQNSNAGIGYRLRMLQHLTGELRANWADNKGIGVLSSGGDTFSSTWLGGGPIFELKRSLALRVEAAYVHQSDMYLSGAAGNHCLVQASLDYHFRKNLGD
jgi:hypothetical protein